MTRNRWAAFVTSAISFAAILSCRTENPPLTGPQLKPRPPVDYPVEETKQDGLTVTFDPRVDVLFVIDDSRSMKNHQENLSRNIHRFVDEFAKVGAIDFHIGFTVVHDHTRYGPIVPETCPDGRINWEAPGTLKSLTGPGDKLPNDGRRFLTKTDDFRAILRDSLDPNRNTALVKELINPDPANSSLCPYGPEEEEVFTPLLAALEDPSRLEGPNRGFRRPGAFFVAILVSDAKDGSGLTPTQVEGRIARATGQTSASKRRFRVFSVAMKPGTKIDAGCKPDPAFATQLYTSRGSKVFQHRYGAVVGNDENPLAVLADLTTGDGDMSQVLSICDKNYGETLAHYGARVQQDALSDVTIELRRRPQATADPSKKLRVFLGNEELPQGTNWRYDPEQVAVVVFGQKINWNAHANEKIRVTYTPVVESQVTAKPMLNF